MNFIEPALFITFLAILSVPLATRLRLPLEIFLVIGSGMISLLPGLPSITVNPTVVFDLFLPPILFSAAYWTSWRDFKFNIRPITLLAFGLVLCTTIIVAVLIRFLIPNISWAEGFLLGAILSPSDASAATAIIKKLNAPRRLVAILEGESLINDASALTLFRFSLLAMLQSSFSMTYAVTQFVVVTIGGAAVGIIIAYSATYIIKNLRDVLAETTFTCVIAFIAYLLAEYLNVSGVISTVVAGIFFGRRFPEIAHTQTRVNAKAIWATLLFVINGFVFALLGLQLPSVIKNLGAYSVMELVLYGITISVTVILVRILWMFPAAYIPRFLFPSIAKKDPVPSTPFLFVVGWTGMRGIVSLAAAFAIPYYIAPGIPFPHRDLIIFLTYCVILSTLIPPALTLPFLFRHFNLSETDNKIQEEANARIRSMEGVIGRLNELRNKDRIPASIYDEFLNQIERKLNVIQTQLEDKPFSSLSDDYVALKKLSMTALRSERETLIKLRKNDEIHDEVFHALLNELDMEEMRIKSVRI